MPLPLDTPFPTPFPPDHGQEIQRRTPGVSGSAELTHLHARTITTPLPAPVHHVLPFHPVRLVIADANTNAYLQPGYVLHRHKNRLDNANPGPIELIEPKVGVDSIWGSPVPPLQLAGNISFNYLAINTNPKGEVVGNVSILSSTTVLNSAHHYPPDPVDPTGGNGSYRIEIFRTNLASSNRQERVKLKWGGHYMLDQALWHGTHPAGDTATAGRGLPYIQHREIANRYEFRAHLEAHGHNITQATNTITHKFLGSNVGTSATNVGNIYQGDDGTRDARFNIITERQTNPQVTVFQSSKNSPVEIHGNGKDGTVTFRDCNGNTLFTLSQTDGLGTWSGSHIVVVGTCPGNSNS